MSATWTATPVFVYGTLREGFGNDRLWHPHATRREAPGGGRWEVRGYNLVTNGGFPYAVPTPYVDGIGLTARIVGELIEATDAEHEAEMMKRLDYLEGVPHHYRRALVSVELHGSANDLDGYPSLNAVMYQPTDGDDASRYARLHPVPENDWAKWTGHSVADTYADRWTADEDEWDPDDDEYEGPTCSICDGLGHGYPGGGPCPLEERGSLYG